MFTEQRQKSVLCIISLCMLAFVSCGVGAENNNSKAEITLSRVIPVINEELAIRVINATPVESDVEFTLSFEGKTIHQGKFVVSDGIFETKWTPKQTGTYTVSVKLGKKNNIQLTREFPVVWRELYFLAWPPMSADEFDLYPYLSTFVIVTAYHNNNDQAFNYLRQRGVRLLRNVSFRVNRSVIDPNAKVSKRDYIDSVIARWSKELKKGYDGLYIDEFGLYPGPDRAEMEGVVYEILSGLRSKFPNKYIFPAVSGALLRESSISFKNSDSIALMESYSSYCSLILGTHSPKKHFEQRIETARNTDLIFQRGRKHAALIFLGFNGVGLFEPEPSTPRLEDQVRYIKKQAPEMPGIAFYDNGVTKPWLVQSGQLKAAEELVNKYYIKPVVDLREIWFSDYSPKAGEPVNISVNIHNLGGMDAKKIKIKLYAVESGSNNKKQIGEEITLNKIGCGFAETKKHDSTKKFEYQELNGNKYTVMDRGNTVFLATAVVTTSWTPSQSGYYTIIVEVEPSDNFTILDGIIRQDIGVSKR